MSTMTAKRPLSCEKVWYLCAMDFKLLLQAKNAQSKTSLTFSKYTNHSWFSSFPLLNIPLKLEIPLLKDSLN